MAKKRKPLPPHWYKITVHYCPVCCSEEWFRERVYGEKPADYRTEWVEFYDHCQGF